MYITDRFLSTFETLESTSKEMSYDLKASGSISTQLVAEECNISRDVTN